jgi:hypothetical protein
MGRLARAGRFSREGEGAPGRQYDFFRVGVDCVEAWRTFWDSALFGLYHSPYQPDLLADS